MIEKDYKCLKLIYECKAKNLSGEDLTHGN